jgi:hypothetical protein
MIFYCFCLMIEGSGCGSGRPKNMRIRIPNTELFNEDVQGDVEEAVARARLDWLKRMPEMAGGGGESEGGGGNSRLHRESLGQLGNNNNNIINLYFHGIRLRVPSLLFYILRAIFFKSS